MSTGAPTVDLDGVPQSRNTREMAFSAWLGLSDGVADRREALFGGVGAVRVWNLLGTGRAEPFSAVLACELEPGASVGPHVQQRDPEIVLGVEGSGVAEVAGTAYPLIPGAVIHVPHGKRLSLQNASATDPLRYLIIKSKQALAESPP